MARRRQKKATSAQVEVRTAQVYDWIVEGQPSHRIVELAGSAWGLRPSMAREYIRRATERLKEEGAKRATATLESHLAARWHCYRRAHETGDVKTAAMVLKDIGRLQALYASDRSLLAKAGLDESLTQRLSEADAQAADILRAVYKDA